MSLLSRWFRKASPPSSGPASSLREAPSKKAEEARSKPSAADRALAAAAEENALQSAIAAGDVQAVARLVVSGSSTKIRQAAAEAIDDPERIRQLIRDVRGGNDKNVYKVLTTKRDALVERARQRELMQARIDAVAKDLERHGRSPCDALYGPRLEELEILWNDVAAQAEPPQREKVEQWIDRARQTLAEHSRQVAEQAAREQAAADAAAEARRLREEEAQASAAAAAEQAQVDDEQKRALAERQQAEQQAVRQIGELLRKARGALSDGNTSRAASLRRLIEEKRALGADLPVHLASQIQQLDQQLDDLKDWKNFSVAPKRAELIEEMASLVGAALDPPTLAERIKSLKEEWRTLGKGVGTALDPTLEADRQRFQETADKAYEPCREYFAAQALVREENLRRREVLFAKLTAFEAGLHGEQTDWRAVIKELRETQQAWRGIAPVDPQAARPQQQRFSALCASLQGRLDAEYARNLKTKQALIERAGQLLAIDDGRKAIDAVKTLQREWQAVGPVPREADQRLWGEFRGHCDAVFQKRQQASAAHTAGLENNKAQAVALCEQIEKIAALDGPELLAHAGARTEWRKAFEALGEFPRADTRELGNRFDRARERFEKALARQHARDAGRAWDDLFEAAGYVCAYGFGLARGLDAGQLDTLKKTAENFIASVPRWPGRGLEALRRGLTREHGEDLAANEAALRRLCIRAEILADLPTPAEDQALRRDYQLQRLVQRMGQGLKADEAPLDLMAIEWVGVGPVEPATYEALLQRFRRCRDRGG